MTPEVVIAALAGTITTIASLFWRELVRRAAAAEADAAFWRDRALQGTGLAEMSLDEAERADARPARRRAR